METQTTTNQNPVQPLNIEKFSPAKAELTTLVEKYKTLEIKGVDDVQGYAAVDVARKELKKVRVQIEKDGKALRAEAIAFQKAVIEKEKELVGIIEPLEIELTEKKRVIDEEKIKIERREVLPERLAKLQEIGLTPADDFILEMDDLKFSEYFNQAKSDYLIEKERKQKEEREAAELKLKQEAEEAQKKIREEQEAAQKKIEEERKKIEEEKAQAAKEKAEAELKLKQEQEAAQKKIDEEKAKIEAEKLAIEKEKQRIIDEEKAKKEAEEKARKDAEEAAKKEEERKTQEEADRIENERIVKEKLEKEEKYQQFLASHSYKNDGTFLIENHDGIIVLYKKLGELLL